MPATQSQPTAKLSAEQFAQSIKTKYPQYASVDNATLTQKMLAKYPQYADRVDTTAAPNPSQPPQSFGDSVVGAAKGIFRTIAKPFVDTAAIPVQLLAKATGQPDPYANNALSGIDVNPVNQPIRKLGSAGEVASYLFPYGKAAAVAKPLLGRAGANIFSGLAGGYATDVAANAASGKKGSDILKPGAGTVVGGAIPAAGEILPRVAKGAGKFASQVLGATTGAGASSIKAAADGSPSFIAAMRGKINPDEVVQTAQDALDTIKTNRRTAYLGDLAKVGQNKASLDISPLHDELKTQLKNFGVTEGKDGLDFGRSSIANNGSARADIQGVYDTLKQWGTKEGDRTPVGLDTLKKQLGDFYSQSGSARAFVQAINSKLGGILKEQVPGYHKMTKGYQQASALIDDIKSATGLGGKAKIDTVFSKLTTAMKGDKELRLEILNTMSKLGEQPDLLDKIAGVNMSPLVPRGLVGKGIDVGTAWAVLHSTFSPQYLPMLLSTSPRMVGEFVNGLGIGARKTKVILDALRVAHASKLLPLAPAASAQLSQSQGQTQ